MCIRDSTYLYRLFKEETGTSVIGYINQCRIRRACTMLSSTTAQVKDVALSVGFSDQLYFSKVFKKINGITPTEYRKKHLSDNVDWTRSFLPIAAKYICVIIFCVSYMVCVIFKESGGVYVLAFFALWVLKMPVLPAVFLYANTVTKRLQSGNETVKVNFLQIAYKFAG